MNKIISCLLAGFSLVTMDPLAAAEEKKTGKTPSSQKKVTEAKPKTGSTTEALGADLSSSQRSKLMEILNKGDEAALTSLPGVGATRAKAIVKARPLKDLAALQSVDGMGEATVSDIVAHAKAGFPEAEKKEASTSKPKGESKGKAKPKAKAKGKGEGESKP